MAPEAGQARASRRDRVALGLFGALWVLPFLQPVHLKPFMHFEAEWLAASIGLLAAALALSRGGHRVPRHVWFLPCSAFWIALQPVVVDWAYPGSVVLPVAALLWALLLYLGLGALTQRLGRESVFSAMAMWILAGAVLAALVALLQVRGVPEWASGLVWSDGNPRGTRILPSGNIRHRGHLSIQLAFGVLAACWLHAHGALSRRFAYPAVLLLVAVLVLTTQRAAFAYLLVIPLALLLAYGENALLRRRFLALSLCALAGLFALQDVAPRIVHGSSQGKVSTLARVQNDPDATGAGVRLPLYRTAWEMFAQAPLTGAGGDTFSARHHAREHASSGYLYTTHAHNQLLHLLSSFGLLGSVPALLFVAFGLRRLWSMRALAGAGLAAGGLAILGLACLIELPLSFAYFLAPFVLLLAAGATGDDTTTPGQCPQMLPPLLVAGIATCLLLAAHGYVSMVAPWLKPMSRQAMIGRFDAARGNPFVGPLADSVLEDMIELDRRAIALKLEMNARVMAWRPGQRTLWRRSALLALDGRPDEADRAFDLATHAFPRGRNAFVGHLCSGPRLEQAALRELVGRAAARSSFPVPDACN